MKFFAKFARIVVLTTIFSSYFTAFSNDKNNFLSDFIFISPADPISDVKPLHYNFQGYTSHWDKFSWDWYIYNGLYHHSQSTIESDLWKLEMDIGNQLLLDELWIQKGFVSDLAHKNLPILSSPSLEDLNKHSDKKELLIIGVMQNQIIQEILKKLPQQLQFRRNLAFYLNNDVHRIFVITSHTQAEVDRLYDYILQAKKIIENYTLSKGLVGVHTNNLLITPAYHNNPYTLINKAIQIGCSWIMISGYNDWMIPKEVNKALTRIDFPFIFLPGQYGSGGVMYGMERYPNIQNNTVEECLNWVEAKKGYYFSNLRNAKEEFKDRYHGYMVTGIADQKTIDSLKAPFITNAGTISIDTPPAMILFLNKGVELNEKNIWQTILKRQTVALFDNGQMMGPREFCDPLKILILEREYLAQQFNNDITIDAQVLDNELTVIIHNLAENPVSGTVYFQSPDEIIVGDNIKRMPIELLSSEVKSLKFPLNITPNGYDKDTPIAVIFQSNSVQYRTLTHIESPSPIELQPLILDVPGKIYYPFTIYNYSNDNPVAELEVYAASSDKIIHRAEKTLIVAKGHKTISNFELTLEPGLYIAKIKTLGITKEGKISITPQSGMVTVYKEDMNNDGIPEIVMENSKVKAKLLLFGGRVIEYIIKNRNENLLFKLWPKKPPWAEEPRGVRAFYPYGGLEEFTGYPYIGGHIVFNYEIQENGGIKGQVRLWANIHGSKIEKYISLFGDSEVLEARYAMNDMVPSITVIGINPLIQIGPSTGPEDIYYFPTAKLEERHPELERYYGDMFFLKEGWAAGYDTKMDVSLIVGYPVNNAMFLHLWNNHPNNTPTPYYYTELQPWIKVKPKTTTYFSYFLFGKDGDWQAALDDFKKLGILTRMHENK